MCQPKIHNNNHKLYMNKQISNAPPDQSLERSLHTVPATRGKFCWQFY
jgi:hypothetical protein